jgi:predicted nuclease with TOPRIM domain
MKYTSQLIKEILKGQNPTITTEKIIEAYDFIEMKKELVKLAQKNLRLIGKIERLEKDLETIEHDYTQLRLSKSVELNNATKNLSVKFNDLTERVDKYEKTIIKAFGMEGLNKFKYFLERV